MSKGVLRAAVSFLALVACASGQESRSAPAPDTDRVIRGLAAGVMTDRIVARAVEICAFGGRLPGSPAATKAAIWAVEQLKSFGIAEVELSVEGPCRGAVLARIAGVDRARQ